MLLAFAGTFLIATGGNFASLSLPWQGLAWGLVDAVSTAAMSIVNDVDMNHHPSTNAKEIIMTKPMSAFSSTKKFLSLA